MARIEGTPGNDTLNGTSSSDTMYGYEGNDILSPAESVDTVTDFNGDLIQVRGVDFGGGLSSGLLDDNQFVLGAAATTGSHRFVYDSGRLYFDRDGTGSANQVLIANLSNGGLAATVRANNIQVI